MKILSLTLLAAIFFSFNLLAQSYTFSQSTATYTDLPAPTVISGTGIWDDTSVVVPIGFPFTFGATTYTDVKMMSNGVLMFKSGPTEAAIVAYDADLASLGTSTSTSPIGYQVTGTAGNRIFKMEWKNAGFFDGSGSDFVNMQVWIYEGSNKVETRIGSTSITDPLAIFGTFGGPANGVATSISSTTTYTGTFIQGSPSAALAVPLVNAVSYPFLTAPPVANTLYIYNAPLVGLSKASNNSHITVYPNPVSEELKIEGLKDLKGPLTIRIYDMLGKVILTRETAAEALIPVSVEHLNKGAYFVEIISGKERSGKQIIKL